MVWTLEKLRCGLDAFYKMTGRYPTSQEIDNFPNLPSSRQIQRRFGGVVSLRKTLGLPGQIDYTKGPHSSRRASYINKRAHSTEKEVYLYLIKNFGKEFVHREYFFTDDRRTRADFLVYHIDGEFIIDVFFPANRQNLLGCLNSKMKNHKEGSNSMGEHITIFLMMNKNINEVETTAILKNKKNKLLRNQQMLTYKQFKDFCNTKKRLSI